MFAPDTLTPRAREIADAALELLEAEGAEGLSMRRLAGRLGIRAPSIYKHFPDKDALEAAIISIGFELQSVAFEAALAEGGDPLTVLAGVYRAFAREHPHLYRLMTGKELDRARLTPGAEARAALPVIEAAGDDRDLARAVWAFAHGMTILELDRRFPPEADLDAAWRRGLDALRTARPAH
jgi:AcrR family transcriptional regulator